MAAAMPIVFTAAALAGLNEWIQTDQIPWRIGIAGLALGLVASGMENIAPKATLAFAVTMLATAAVTPFHGNSPVEEFAQFIGSGPKQASPVTSKKVTNHG